MNVFVLAEEEEQQQQVKSKVTTTTNAECILNNQVRRKNRLFSMANIFLSDRIFVLKSMLKAIFNILSIYKRISILLLHSKVSTGIKVRKEDCYIFILFFRI